MTGQELPTDREKALEAVAGGWTRQPTFAHPDCLCGGRAQHTPVTFREKGAGDGWWVMRGRTQTVPCPIHQGRR